MGARRRVHARASVVGHGGGGHCVPVHSTGQGRHTQPERRHKQTAETKGQPQKLADLRVCVVRDLDRWPPCVGGRQGLSEAPGERPGWGSNPAAQPRFWAQRCIARTLVADPWPRARHQDHGECRRLCSRLPGLLSVCLSLSWCVRGEFRPILPPAGTWSLCPCACRVSKILSMPCSAWLRTRWDPAPRGRTTSTCCTQESKADPAHPPHSACPPHVVSVVGTRGPSQGPAGSPGRAQLTPAGARRCGEDALCQEPLGSSRLAPGWPRVGPCHCARCRAPRRGSGPTLP